MRIIDVHVHEIGRMDFDESFWPSFLKGTLKDSLMQCSDAGIDVPIVSSMDTYFCGGHVEEELHQACMKQDNLYMWTVLAPHMDGHYERVSDMLSRDKVVGIKINPGEFGWGLPDEGEDVFRFAAKHKAVVLCHTVASFDPCLPSTAVSLADKFPEMHLIVCHLGLGHDCEVIDPSKDPFDRFNHRSNYRISDAHIHAVASSKHGNVSLDLAGHRLRAKGLIEKAVRELGSERLIFGSDAPLHLAASMASYIKDADISDRDRENIFHLNAERLLGIGGIKIC